MKVIPVTQYQCETCKTIYHHECEALRCESRAVSQDRGVKIGDRVRITGGDGKGNLCEVESVSIINMGWGHHFADRYWHTIAVSGKVIDSWGSRFLTHDDYEVLK